MTCKFTDCTTEIHSRQLCRKHYTACTQDGSIDTISPHTQHKLSNVSIEDRTAVCAVCGPVSHLYYRESRNQLICQASPAWRRSGRFKYGNGEYISHEQTVIARRDFREKQGTLCAICGGDKGLEALALDHCHSTGKLRGLLCRDCNLGLGNFKDSIEILHRAIEYLDR